MGESPLWLAIKARDKAKRTKCHHRFIEKLEARVAHEASKFNPETIEWMKAMMDGCAIEFKNGTYMEFPGALNYGTERGETFFVVDSHERRHDWPLQDVAGCGSIRFMRKARKVKP